MIEIKNMRAGEKIIKIIKVHWITYVILGLHFLFVLIISALFHFIMGVTAISFLLTTLLWLVSLMMIYIEWLNYEFDLLIITNHRIISIEEISFLNRTVSETNLNQIVEVNSKTKGLLSNLLNYGDIFIQTAGNKTTISIEKCPDSIQEARNILNIVEAYKDTTNKEILK